jgi:hypothetical protein
MNILTLALLTVQLLPSVPRYVGGAGSLAVGVAVAALLVIAFYLMNWTISARQHAQNGGYIDTAFVLLLLIMVLAILPHALVADILHPVLFLRLAESIASLLLMIAGALALGGILSRATDRQVKRAINTSLALLCVVVLFRLVGLEPLESKWERPMFPFSEPSHFALAFLPILLYRCASAGRRASLAWLFFAVVTALVIKSFTLLLGCILAAMVCRRLVMMSTMGLVLGLAALPLLDLTYFALRLSGSSGNVSGLVYAQGWQLVAESLGTSSGWGLGFEQLGVDGTGVPLASIIHRVTGTDLNVMDGSFVFAKLTSEFGAFGAVAGVLYCLLALHAVRALRRGEAHAATRFAYCIIAAYTMDLLARGAGYFTDTALLMIAAFGVLATRREFTSKVVNAIREVVIPDLRSSPPLWSRHYLWPRRSR